MGRTAAGTAAADQSALGTRSALVKMAPGPLAQLVEQETLNLKVVGSIPTWPISDPSGVGPGSRAGLVSLGHH